ncbi:MAG: hypothetical protein M3N19_10640, partial [Candidatus Eremiobacteraeota bacterium]|nr:hypothetical protein [Candidatus Eremiobacteraeota bacterium]
GLLGGIFALSDCDLRRLLAPASVLLLVVAAGVYGQQHVAPIWPDAMRAAPSLHAPIASIWHDELQATGQLGVQPFWAALRLLTLAGSGFVAWASIATATRRDQLEMS